MAEKPEAIAHVPEADSFDFRSAVERVKLSCLGHKWLIAGTCCLSVLVVIAYIVIWPPVYSAEVVLAAESAKDSQRENFYQAWAVFRKEPVADEIQRMTTGPVLGTVIDKLDLKFEDVYHPFFSHITYLWTESWVGKNYRNLKNYLSPPSESAFLPTEEELERGRTATAFKEGISLQPYPETNIGRLAVLGPTPRVAEYADTLIATYLESRRARHVAEANDAYQSLYTEVDKTQQEITELENRIQAYYDENSMLLQFEKDKVDLITWQEMKGSIGETESVIATIESTLEEIGRQLASEEQLVTSATVYSKNNIREAMRDQLYDLVLERDRLKFRYQPESPEVLEMEAQIRKLEQLIEAEPEVVETQTTRVLSQHYEGMRQRRNRLISDLVGARAGLRVKVKTAQDMKDMIDKIPEKMQAVRRFGRELTILERKNTILQEKLMMAEVSRTTALSAPASITVVEYASPPVKPSWPNKKMLVSVSVIVGLFGGACLALLVDLVYVRVTRYQLTQNRSGMSVYAIVGKDRHYAEHLFNTTRKSVLSSRNGASDSPVVMDVEDAIPPADQS